MLTRLSQAAFLTLLAAAGCGFFSPAHADWQAGLAAFKAGELETAEREFRGLAEAQPDWHGGHLMLGQTLMRQSRAAEAIPHLQQAVGLKPGDAASSLALGQAAVLAGRFELASQALSAVEPGSLDDKSQERYHRLRGQAAVGLGDHGGAARYLEQAVRRAPKDARLRYQLATVALKVDEVELALEHLEAAAGLQPQNPKFLGTLTRTRYAHATGLVGEAKVDACRVAAADGGGLLTKAPSAETLLLLGKLELCAGEPQKAEELLARSLAKDTKGWQTSYYLARAQTLLQRWEAAEKTLTPLVGKAHEPRVATRIASLLGYVYEGQQRYELAIEQYAQTGESEKVARAREALGIQNRNREIDRIAQEIREIEKAQEQLDQEEKEIGLAGSKARETDDEKRRQGATGNGR